jgi:hypothetical protein
MDGSGWELVHELEAQLTEANRRIEAWLEHLEGLIQAGDHMARHVELTDCRGAALWRQHRKMDPTHGATGLRIREGH